MKWRKPGRLATSPSSPTASSSSSLTCCASFPANSSHPSAAPAPEERRRPAAVFCLRGGGNSVTAPNTVEDPSPAAASPRGCIGGTVAQQLSSHPNTVAAMRCAWFNSLHRCSRQGGSSPVSHRSWFQPSSHAAVCSLAIRSSQSSWKAATNGISGLSFAGCWSPWSTLNFTTVAAAASSGSAAAAAEADTSAASFAVLLLLNPLDLSGLPSTVNNLLSGSQVFLSASRYIS